MTLFDIDAKQVQRVLDDQPDGDLAESDRVHREHAHVEDRIRGAKDTSARSLPCGTFERNAVWLRLVMTGQDLMARNPLPAVVADPSVYNFPCHVRHGPKAYEDRMIISASPSSAASARVSWRIQSPRAAKVSRSAAG